MADWLDIIIKRKNCFNNANYEIGSDVNKYLAATSEKDEKEMVKCNKCKEELEVNELKNNLYVCNECNYHFRINCIDRLNMIFDKETIELFDENLISENPINFPNYDEKLNSLVDNLGINEAVITGKGDIFGNETYFGIMDYRFIMGSMGSVVGEKLTRMIEKATKHKKSIIIMTASGGARMQEGMIALYQMSKVVAAIEKHSEQGLLYISVLTDPTTGGVLASFASIADVIIAEPNATIGFAGKRVIKNTIKEKIPENFQTSEFYFENGHIDMICERKNLKSMLSKIISFYRNEIPNKIDEIIFKEIACDLDIHDENSKLNEWNIVKLARHSKRPNFKNYIDCIFDDFIELHGDRICGDDHAIVTGIAKINDIPVTVVLNAKGKTLDENIKRNFGMANPEGYRKVIRITKQSEKFKRPVICFIDTPGAYCGVEAEQKGQGESIASCIKNFMKLKTPVIAVITGEGGSGGALALGVSDWIFMLENSIYSVISPEGCSSILFKDATKADIASEYLKLTSYELLKLNIIDEIIPEGKGAHEDGLLVARYIKNSLTKKLIELINLDIDTILKLRNHKFRKQGVFKEV